MQKGETVIDEGRRVVCKQTLIFAIHTMKKISLYIILILVLIACQKEYSIENTIPPINIATGSLQDSAGNCSPIQVYGTYKETDTLTSDNHLIIEANFTNIGYYRIYSDTLNGFYFNVSGYAFSTGIKQLTIYGYGKPLLPINTNFKLHFGNKICLFTVLNDNPNIQTNTNNDYFPTTTNSTWTYDNTALNDTSVVTVLAKDTIIYGNTYRRFELNVPVLNKKDTLYYRKDGAGNYYRYYVVGTGIKTEFPFLKDYATTGVQWESPVVVGYLNGVPTNVKYHFTLVDRNVSATIGTNNIDSIITVQEETQYFENSNWNTKNTFIYSFAKKIGLVDITQENNIPNLLVPVRSWKIY
jgi:hypothetical protein